MDYREIPGHPLNRTNDFKESIAPYRQPTVVDEQPKKEAFTSSNGYFGGGQYESDGQKFRGGISFSGSSPIINHAKTRANSREAYHTSLIAHAMVKRFVEVVVGDGIRIEPAPAWEVIGITQGEAEAWARDFKDRFEMYASSKECSYREDMTLYQKQALAEIEAQRDGEYFKRFYYLNDPGRMNPLAIDDIEQSQIVGDAYTATQGFSTWTNDGIIRDARGREIGYKVRYRNTKGVYKDVTVPAKTRGRRMMLHGFSPEYAGQSRGFPEMHNSLQEMAQFTNLSIAHIQKATIQATIVMSKESDLGAIPSGPTFSPNTTGVSPVIPPGQTEVLDGQTASSTVPDYRPVDTVLSAGGIGIFDNNPGEKLKAFQDSSPSDSFAPFAEAFISHICAASSMPYEVFIQKFNSNYTAARAALVQIYRLAVMRQANHVSDFLSEVQLAWASEEIAAGRIQCKGWLDPMIRAAWMRAVWHGPKMPDVDPVKSVKAARDAIEAEISNAPLEAKKYNGSDASTNKSLNERIYEGSKPVPWNNRVVEEKPETEKTKGGDDDE